MFCIVFKELELKTTYRTLEDDLSKSFYIPILKRSCSYKRSAGYFTSSAFNEVREGIEELVKNKGYVQILTSPQLSQEDIEAIRKGYASRKEIIENSLMKEIVEEKLTEEEKTTFGLLAQLIAINIVDIRVVYLEENDEFGIYHDKSGIATDREGEKIAFVGSMNATQAALTKNYETIDVFSSSFGEGDRKRIEIREKDFDEIWNEEKPYFKISHLPENVQNKMKQYAPKELPEFVKTHPAYEDYLSSTNRKIEREVRFAIPETIELRGYQKEAIEKWTLNDYSGIFSMATGTGKTFTGLAAAVHLYETLEEHLAIIVVVPYQHLVMQWVDDMKSFGLDPIIGFSTSPQKNWESRLKRAAMYYRINDKKPNIFSFVTTNATFSLERVQKILRRMTENVLLIVDEAHNLGAPHLQTKLLPSATYRLGLSATITRYGDEEGTEALLQYFKGIVFTYTLEEAIRNNMLTPYEYYPIIVSLTEDELEKYKQLTYKIAKAIRKDKYGKVKFTESAKMLLIQRSRLVAGAKNKLDALENEIKKHQQDSHLLIYCGATTINDIDYVEGEVAGEELRQIDAVSHLLGNELQIRTTKFTSEENQKERTEILKQFEKGDTIQALSAIRCLDEGVNIPSIQKVFLLASSTNPKEYIQRRGRVLRKFKGKDKAYIYDFITLPVPLESIYDYSLEERSSMRGLAAREVERMRDFAEIAENSFSTIELIYEIKDAFLLNEEIEGREFE